eukprot:10735_1
MAFSSILMTVMICFVTQSMAGIPGGWSQITDTSRVQNYVNEIRSDIITLLNEKDGINISPDSSCAAQMNVIAGTQQVVAGMNYAVSIRVCNADADVEFFVPLGEDAKPINPKVTEYESSDSSDSGSKKKRIINGHYLISSK